MLLRSKRLCLNLDLSIFVGRTTSQSGQTNGADRRTDERSARMDEAERRTHGAGGRNGWTDGQADGRIRGRADGREVC